MKYITQMSSLFSTNDKTPDLILMGNLPSQQVQPARTFLNTGVDCAGPEYIRSSSSHSKIRIKSYIPGFFFYYNAATHVIHLELVSELMSEAFLSVLC